MQNAKNHGVTREEIAAIITHVTMYVGWPKGWAVFRLAKEVWNEEIVEMSEKGERSGGDDPKSIGHILAVLIFMFLIHLLFGRFDQYYKNVYIPIFRLKVDCFVNEKIIRKANYSYFLAEQLYENANITTKIDESMFEVIWGSEIILK